jgi:hypothetical protein
MITKTRLYLFFMIAVTFIIIIRSEPACAEGASLDKVKSGRKINSMNSHIFVPSTSTPVTAAPPTPTPPSSGSTLIETVPDDHAGTPTSITGDQKPESPSGSKPSSGKKRNYPVHKTERKIRKHS